MFKKIISTTATRVFTAIISVVVLGLNASELGPEGIATIGIIILDVSIVSLVSGLLGSSSLSYFVSRKPLGKLLLISLISITASILLLFGIELILQNLPRLYFKVFMEGYFLHIVLLSILQSFYVNNMAILIGKEKIFTHNLLTLLQFTSLIAVLLILFSTKPDPQVIDYLIAYYISIGAPLLVSSLFIALWIAKGPSQPSSKGLIKEVFNYGWAVQTASLVQIFNYRLWYYFLNVPSGKQDLGVFTTSNQLSEGLWIFGKSVSLVQYARIANSKDMNYNQALTLQLFKFTFFITALALGVVLLIPGEWFVLILKHAEYAMIPTIILYLSPGILALVVKMIFAHYFSGTGRPRINLVASLISLGIAILSASLLIPRFGIIGASIGASITYIVGGLILLVLFKRDSKAKWRAFLITKDDFTSFWHFIKGINASK